MCDDVDAWRKQEVCAATGVDATAACGESVLISVVNAELDALPLDLSSAEEGELQDALLRLHGGGKDDQEESPSQSSLVGATVFADEDVLMHELLALDAVDALLFHPVDGSVDATSESLANHEVGGSCAGASAVGVGPPASSSTSGGGASSSSAESGPAKDSNPTRRRVKQELDHLRERVSGLQATLHALQQSQPTNATAGTRKPDDAWEGIAARQRLLHRKAELENAKLRESLEAQLQLAKSLERLLHKRPSLWTNEAVSSKRLRVPGRVSGVIDDAGQEAATFETLIAKVDQSYASYRETLTKSGLLSAPTGYRATSVKPTTCSGGESVCVELLDVKGMPFEASATCSAAWRCITSGYMQLEHEVYRGFEGASDILAIKYAVTMTRKRLSVDFAARAVMKKFVDGDRVVFVWESISDTDGAHCGAPIRRNPGIQVQEQGWTVFASQELRGEGDDNDNDDDYQNASGSSTRILTCMRMTPLVSSPSTNESVDVDDEGRQVGLLTNLSLDYFGEQLDHAHEAIESLLLDERHG